MRRPAFAAALAAALLAVVLPIFAPAVVQNLEARYRAALQALGGTAPPPVPKHVLARLKAQPATLASAQSRVPFTIVAPAGLPHDVVASKIRTVPTGVYSRQAHSWRIGSPQVTFAYRRAGGREFVLIADRYDPHGEQPSKYMFEAMAPGPDGRPVLVKHEQFAWRNGNQITIATEGEGISAAEIRTIEAAMHGTPVPLRPLHHPATGGTMKVRVITPP